MGADSEWDYTEITAAAEHRCEATITDYIETMYVDMHDVAYNDKYRGIEYEFVKLPPKEWLTNQIESCNVTIQSYKRSIERYQELLNQHEERDTKICEAS